MSEVKENQETESTDIVQAGGAFGSGNAFALAQREAKAFAASNIVPDRYRNNIPNCLVAMEVSRRIGAGVLAVMQSLYIVGGKPSFVSSFLIATVNSCGRFTPLRFRTQGKPFSDDWGIRAYAKDKETGEECEGPLVDVKMAKAEGWWSKKDKHGNECSKWQTMPELMLHYRAAAFWQRIYAPELSLGMHTREEMEDVQAVVVGRSEVIEDTPKDIATGLDGVKSRVKDKIEEKQPEETKESEPESKPGEDKELVTVPEDAFNVFDELDSKLNELYGNAASEKLKAIAKKAGFKSAMLTEKQAGILLDVLNEGEAK